MSDGRFGIIYPTSGYVRVSLKSATREQIMKWPLRLYQINQNRLGIKGPKEVSKVLVFSVAEQFEMLAKFDRNNCGGGGLQS